MVRDEEKYNALFGVEKVLFTSFILILIITLFFVPGEQEESGDNIFTTTINSLSGLWWDDTTTEATTSNQSIRILDGSITLSTTEEVSLTNSMFLMDGNYSIALPLAMMDFNPLISGTRPFFGIFVQPIINTSQTFTVFPIKPTYSQARNTEIIVFDINTGAKLKDYNQSSKILSDNLPRTIAHHSAFLIDKGWIHNEGVHLGGSISYQDFTGGAKGIRDNLLTLNGGVTTYFNLGSGVVTQSGLRFKGFENTQGLDSIIALNSTGGYFNFLEGSKVNVSYFSTDYPFMLIPLGGFWIDDDVTGSISTTLTGANTRHNITGLSASNVMVGENTHFYIDEGLGTINFTSTGEGVYRVYMGASFMSSEIGVYHCAVYKNWVEKQEVSLQREISSVNSVVDAGKVGFVRVVNGDFINIQCEVDVSTNPLVTINHFNFNVERVSR